MKNRKVKSELNMSDAEMLNLPENKRFENETQHTPIPWEVGPHAIDIRTVDNNVDAVHVVCTMPGPKRNQEYRDVADAAFIVRAVNVHEDLLKMLKCWIVRYGNTTENKWLAENSRAAISKAEEGL